MQQKPDFILQVVEALHIPTYIKLFDTLNFKDKSLPM